MDKKKEAPEEPQYDHTDLRRLKRKSIRQLLVMLVIIALTLWGKHIDWSLVRTMAAVATGAVHDMLTDLTGPVGQLSETLGESASSFVPSGRENNDPDRSSDGPDHFDGLTVSFIDVGQGSATLIECGDEVMLVDTGNYDAKEALLAFLEQKGIDTIKYLVLTHPDADHIANADEVLDAYPVDIILSPDISKDTYTSQSLVQRIAVSGSMDVHPEVGDEYTLGGASFTIIGPVSIDTDEVNNSSIAMKLVYGRNSFVMTGDAEEKEELEILASCPVDLEADVLLVGHHGSSTSTCQAFLEAVDPTYAVISVGTDLDSWDSPFPTANTYYHPHPSVVRRLRDNDVQIYATEATRNWPTGSGTVTAISDGEHISWRFEL